MGELVEGRFTWNLNTDDEVKAGEKTVEKISSAEKLQRIKDLQDKLQGYTPKEMRHILLDFFTLNKEAAKEIFKDALAYPALESVLVSVKEGYTKITDKALRDLEIILAGVKPKKGAASVINFNDYRSKKYKKT